MILRAKLMAYQEYGQWRQINFSSGMIIRMLNM